MKKKYTEGMREVLTLVSDIGDLKIADSQKNNILWRILTALRGPDNGDEPLKDATTARLRGVVVPKLALSCSAIVSNEPLGSQAYGSFNDHFIRHVNLAKDSLEELYGIKSDNY